MVLHARPVSQSFQQSVCVNSSRVNALLQRGEALIQNSEAGDAQRVESRLLELLRRCSLIYNNIARTHTRLLSMRLVHGGRGARVSLFLCGVVLMTFSCRCLRTTGFCLR